MKEAIVHYLTENFTLEEMERSSVATQHGICNAIPTFAVSNLQNLCQEVLQPLREHYGKAIHISSGYRSKELNARVGGARNSQHTTGEAADLVLPSIATGRDWQQWIRQNCPNFDQCILERNRKGCCWLHVSARRPLHLNRHQVFDLFSKN